MIENISKSLGRFAENKETAKRIRARLLRTLRAGEDVVLDFSDVELATQSFIHALIAEAIRDERCDALEHIEFRGCNANVRAVIEVVVSYAQDDWSTDEDSLDEQPQAV